FRVTAGRRLVDGGGDLREPRFDKLPAGFAENDYGDSARGQVLLVARRHDLSARLQDPTAYRCRTRRASAPGDGRVQTAGGKLQDGLDLLARNRKLLHYF